jgi:hypothetical protein
MFLELIRKFNGIQRVNQVKPHHRKLCFVRLQMANEMETWFHLLGDWCQTKSAKFRYRFLNSILSNVRNPSFQSSDDKLYRMSFGHSDEPHLLRAAANSLSRLSYALLNNPYLLVNLLFYGLNHGFAN